MLGMDGTGDSKSEHESPGDGVGSAIHGDLELGTFYIRGYKWPACGLNPASH